MGKRASEILRFAGGFIAWVIGSGFATGQEILQFYSSYGLCSFWVAAINLIGFLCIGTILLTVGFEHKGEVFNHYEYYCGKVCGRVYAWIIPATLVLLMSVLNSAAGTTCLQYFGWNKYIGSAGMAVLVLLAYWIGFEKMVRIVSSVGPVMIAFSIFVGLYTVCRDATAWDGVADGVQNLSASQASPHWSLSAVLYLSLNFLCGSTYYTALGRSANRRADAKWGAVVGSVLVMLTITALSTAILLHAREAEILSVPTLCLAKRISPVFGGVFSVALLMGTFSSSSTMMWSFCSRFFAKDRRKNRLFALGTAVVTYCLGLFPFSGLVAVIYPMIGYAGLFFIGCVVYKGLRKTGGN